jgi:hypothetical protein
MEASAQGALTGNKSELLDSLSPAGGSDLVSADEDGNDREPAL